MFGKDPVLCYADVAGHMIGAFAGVGEPRGVLRDKALEESMQILPRGRVGIFHNDQAATGVPHEKS